MQGMKEHKLNLEPRMGGRKIKGSCGFTRKSHFLGDSSKPSSSLYVLPNNHSLTPFWPGKPEKMCKAM